MDSGDGTAFVGGDTSTEPCSRASGDEISAEAALSAPPPPPPLTAASSASAAAAAATAAATMLSRRANPPNVHLLRLASPSTGSALPASPASAPARHLLRPGEAADLGEAAEAAEADHHRALGEVSSAAGEAPELARDFGGERRPRPWAEWPFSHPFFLPFSLGGE